MIKNGSNLTTQKLVFVVYLSLLVALPLMFSELYPFTINPMFRDSPQKYTSYSLVSATGVQIPAEKALLHQVYDGNPVALGVGAPPEETANIYGQTLSEREIELIVRRELADDTIDWPVKVYQLVFGKPENENKFGLMNSNTYIINETAN